MKILDPIHALILSDRKEIVPQKTRFRTKDGNILKFVRVDTQMNWPRLIVQPETGEQLVIGRREIRSLELTILKEEIVVEPFFE